MTSPSFVVSPASCNVEGQSSIKSGGGLGVWPAELADELFGDDVPGSNLTCYLLRRFGWPNRDCDGEKELCRWALTTPIDDLFLVVTPYMGSGNSHFGYSCSKALWELLGNEMRSERHLPKREAALISDVEPKLAAVSVRQAVCEALKETMDDLMRPVMLDGLSLTIFGVLERLPCSLAGKIKQDKAETFEAAGWMPSLVSRT